MLYLAQCLFKHGYIPNWNFEVESMRSEAERDRITFYPRGSTETAASIHPQGSIELYLDCAGLHTAVVVLEDFRTAVNLQKTGRSHRSDCELIQERNLGPKAPKRENIRFNLHIWYLGSGTRCNFVP